MRKSFTLKKLWIIVITLIFVSCSDDYRFVDGNDENINNEQTHYFYMTLGTMPSLYAGLHVLSHSKPSYFAYERVNTFDTKYLPSHIKLSPANGPDNGSQQIMRDFIKGKILEINKKYPNATFEFYVDDIRSRLGYDWFIGQGIDSSCVKVTLLSDGTATYNLFNNYFGDPAYGETNWEQYKKEINGLNWKNKSTNTKGLPEFDSFTWPYYMSCLPNYKYLLQDFSLLETNSSYVKEEMKNMNTLSITPYEMLNNLTPERQSTFFKMTKFDKNKFSELFDESPKKNLVIIGTINSNNQKNMIDKVYQKYSTNYDIFYKPHPADNDYHDYESTYSGLKLLPAQMPFEIFVWSLIDKIDIIGGNSSTVFITVPVNKVKFIFAASSEVLVQPLNILYKDAENIEWMQ